MWRRYVNLSLFLEKIQRVVPVAIVAGMSATAVAEGTALQVDENARRTVQQGELLGAAGPYDSYVWYGVPYAKPPVGGLRWRAPQPPEPWQGVRAAAAMSKACMQVIEWAGQGYKEKAGDVIGQEDCLYLSIWSPRLSAAEASKKRLPVMLWSHGGGNRFGHGAEYTGAHLASSQNVIVVAVNYRLNFMGWLSHQALRGSGTTPEDRSGNYGTLDHIAALEWVRDNIAQFGGDPRKVTVFGESGGGRNAAALLQSPRAAGLFHGAIVQSSLGWNLYSPAHAENFVTDAAPGHAISSSELLLSLWLADGKATSAEAGREQIRRTSDEAIAAYLRGKSFEDLARGVGQARKRNAAVGRGEAHTANSRNNQPLLYDDGTVLAQNWRSNVPLLIGSTRDEDRGFLAENPRYVAVENGTQRILDKPRFELLVEYLGKLYKAQGVDGPAQDYSRRGNVVYAFRFDWDEQLAPAGDPDFHALNGAHHGAEVALIFGTTDLGREMSANRSKYDQREGSSYRELSKAMMSYWSQFAVAGDPGRGRSGTLPLWSSWESSGFMILDSPAGGGNRMSKERLTKERVLDQLNADPRLANAEVKCRLIDDLRSYFLSTLRPADYRKLGAERCAAAQQD